MKKIEANAPTAKSADIVTDNLSHLQSLFPEVFTEGKVQFDVLRQLLGGTVDETDEKYGLNWHGKRRARQIALTPSTGTLRPCPNESVNWTTTQNLVIEGDNLEVLKLLQKSYAGKVQLIYIDPPYNTGKDFIYPDNFRDSISNYLELTGQVEGGARMSANLETSGRFHTDWLNMMYPRLRLAKNLLKSGGFICVNIDENESFNLRHLLDEIFGPENLAGVVVWKKGSGGSETDFSYTHDQLIFYKKSDTAALGKISQGEQQLSSYQNPDDDSRGPWTSSDYTSKWTKAQRPNLWYPIVNPNTGEDCWPPEQRTWAYSQDETKKNIGNNLLWWGKSGLNERPRYKRFHSVTGGMMIPRSWWDTVGTNEEGTNTFRSLGFSKADFPHPKPISLIKEVMKIGAPDGGLILDFFGGSASTAHAVIDVNATTNSAYQFILIQLPEPITDSEFGTVADVAKERIRRAGKAIETTNPMFSGDTGFKVFKLDRSNIRVWNPNTQNLTESLLEHHEHILEGRTEADIVYELLLKLGLDLCVPMESRNIAGKTVGAVGGGVLMLCLVEEILSREVEAVAASIVSWHKELAPAGDSIVVFRDSAFADDVAKTNMTAILAQNGLENVRSI